ncbi:mitochondrial import receptor subunit TOM5 homolog [Tenrec ecaudatus]|uniref:mitochondrial import receptor subunit TOM5 homolog n=1 Tax=Tenrec ecaudatus TaxID=94439 RepID=UPI003F5A7A26
MYQIMGLTPKPDPEEMRWKLREDMISSIGTIPIHVALLCVTPFILQELDGIYSSGIT